MIAPLKALATCDVRAYGGAFIGHRAYLITFKTTRHGQRVQRLRWQSECASAHEIRGSFASLQSAIDRAKRDPDARNVQL